MLMTEKEAKEKRCVVPFIAYYVPDNTGEMRNPVYESCIATHCPAWWWHDNPDDEDHPGDKRRGLCGKTVSVEISAQAIARANQ